MFSLYTHIKPIICYFHLLLDDFFPFTHARSSITLYLLISIGYAYFSQAFIQFQNILFSNFFSCLFVTYPLITRIFRFQLLFCFFLFTHSKTKIILEVVISTFFYILPIYRFIYKKVFFYVSFPSHIPKLIRFFIS